MNKYSKFLKDIFDIKLYEYQLRYIKNAKGKRVIISFNGRLKRILDE